MTEPRNDDQEMTSSSSSEMPAEQSDSEERERSYFEKPEVEDAIPITGTAPPPVGAAPRYSRRVGEGDAERFFPAGTPDEAEASAAAIAAFCENCPISHKCAEDDCAVWRQEQHVNEVLEAAEGRTAVAGIVLPAAYE